MKKRCILILLLSICFMPISADSAKEIKQIEYDFKNLSNESRPHTYWFWMNGNITKEGITKDLEAMQQVGIGGVLNLEGGTGIPKGAVQYLSPQWAELKAHAIKEASRLGLEFAMHNSPGWSSSGGPWITPEMAMQQLTWSEVYIEGNRKIDTILPLPNTKLDYYQDIVVLAYPSFSNGKPVPFSNWQYLNNSAFNYQGLIEIEDYDKEQIINSKDIIDLTSDLKSDGTLSWKVPKGNWTIVRIGHTPTGSRNAAAPDTGAGLECDKYSKEAITIHINKMLDILQPLIKPYMHKVKLGLEIDSYEVGMQNWTSGFEDIFKNKTGYDLLKYLLVMTGKIVDNKEVSERFLWDIRKVQGDLIADNYYGEFKKLCNENGFLSYIEPYDRGPMEELQIGSRVDIVLGEFWNGLSAVFPNNLMMRRTSKMASSIAHTNGHSIIGAEAFTSEPQSARWQEYPFGLKAVGDKAFTEGINRMVIHRYAQQPHSDAAPAMTQGPWGIHFDRTNTLWKPSKAWLDYLNRSQTLLQKGKFVADFAYFIGERVVGYTRVNNKDLQPSLMKGYDYDLINSETLLRHASVKNSHLTLPDGMKYKVLVLQDQKAMSLELLRKLHSLIQEGLVVVGKRPEISLGLSAYTNKKQKEFEALCNDIWGVIESGEGKKNVGKGIVFWGMALEDVAEEIALKQDFVATSQSGDAPIRYIHRKIDDNVDVYFVSNQRRSYEDLVCAFRVGDRQPEFWNPLTGEITKSNIYKHNDEYTQVPFQLSPYGSTFVVFRSEKSNVDNIQKIEKDGDIILSADMIEDIDRTTYPDVINNFSITCWVKPESDILLDIDPRISPLGYQKMPWTEYYTVYPSNGENLYGQKHSTAGFLVGRNGVAIWENQSGVPIFKLATETSISGWSHIAISYRNGVPSIYINGKLKVTGAQSESAVHPGLGHSYLEEGASYYTADMTKPILHTNPLNGFQIADLATENVIKYFSSTKIVEGRSINDKHVLNFSENGDYKLETQSGKTKTLKIDKVVLPIDISESWTVNFPKGSGAPESVFLQKLNSLHLHEDSGVKHFSGTASYMNKFSVASSMLSKDQQIILDLGEVEVMAEVIINGKVVDVVWARPYELDITNFVQEGENIIEVKVTNQWVNRLIGDEHLTPENTYTAGGGGGGLPSLGRGAIKELPDWYKQGLPKPKGGRVTFATWQHYTKDSPLIQSGLIGPVTIKSRVNIEPQL